MAYPFNQPVTSGMFPQSGGAMFTPGAQNVRPSSSGGQPLNSTGVAPIQGGGFNWGATLPVIGGIGSTLSSLFAPDPLRPESYDVNPGQRALWGRMFDQYKSGAGDFGGGSTAKSGYANLMQMLGGRGIDPRSGAAVGAMGNIASQAAAADAARRDQFGRSLLGTNIQQATRYV